MKAVPLINSFALFLSVLPLSAAENWPQWRGPAATGVAPAANPPTTWSETSHVKWKVRIPGDGTSTPLVWGDKVFVQTAMAMAKPAQPSGSGSASASSDSIPQSNAGSTDSPGRSRPGGPPPRGGRGTGGETPRDPHQFILLC